MTGRFVPKIAIGFTLLSACVLGWALVRHSTSGVAARSSLVHAAAIQAQLGEIEQLRDQDARAASSEPPRQDLFATTARVLVEAGLPDSAIASVAINPSTTLGRGDTGYRAVLAEVTLRGLQPGDTLRLLDRWRASRTLWGISGLEFVASPSRDRADANYTTTIRLRAVFVDGSPNQEPGP